MRSSVLSFAAGAASALVIVSVAGVPLSSRIPTPQRGALDSVDERDEAGRLTSEVSRSTLALPRAETATYHALNPEGELIEPIPDDVEEFFEDYLEHDYVPARIELGRALFHDVRLSTNDTLSCASCHDLRYGGIDRAITPTGYRMQIGSINTPSVFNAVFNLGQFWDGRAPDLETQAGGPPTAPGEMGSTWAEISSKLIADLSMKRRFEEAFPGADFSVAIDSRYVVEAISDFERTLITPNSPFDRYLMGDEEAVSETVKQGYQDFKDLGCIECHNGMAVGGASYQRLGREKEYFDPGMSGVHLGRYNVTGKETDRHFFKVSSLRNIALTAPYLHDGSKDTLEEVIAAMGEYQLGTSLPEHQVARIAEFLRSLTGEFRGLPLDELQNTTEFPTPPKN